MSALREELHGLVDRLPDEQLAPVLKLAREGVRAGRQADAVATLARIQARMHGVTSVDEELDGLRDGTRG